MKLIVASTRKTPKKIIKNFDIAVGISNQNWTFSQSCVLYKSLITSSIWTFVERLSRIFGTNKYLQKPR
jgi:hypothetical protein